MSERFIFTEQTLRDCMKSFAREYRRERQRERDLARGIATVFDWPKGAAHPEPRLALLDRVDA